MLDIAQRLPDARAVYELSLAAEAWCGEYCAQRGIVDAALLEDALFDAAWLAVASLVYLTEMGYSSAITRGKQNGSSYQNCGYRRPRLRQ